MFFSTYVPVNVPRNSCAVYSSAKVFDKAHLMRAVSYLNGEGANDGTFMDRGCVTFMDAPDLHWKISEVFQAYHALDQAQKNNFSFYMVKDTNGVPQLFVSNAFKGHRILINALTYRSVLITHQHLVNKIAPMIDKSYDYTYCQTVYRAIEDIESDKNKYLNALILDSGTKEEEMVLNPITIMYGDVIGSITAICLEELHSIVFDGVHETDSFVVSGSFIERKNLSYYPKIHPDYVKFIYDIYVKCKERKSNYVPIYDNHGEPALYFSTNNRYLVDAKTLECTDVKNQNVKGVLKIMTTQESVSDNDLYMIWELAREAQK